MTKRKQIWSARVFLAVFYCSITAAICYGLDVVPVHGSDKGSWVHGDKGSSPWHLWPFAVHHLLTAILAFAAWVVFLIAGAVVVFGVIPELHKLAAGKGDD